MSRRYRVHAGLVEAIARGDADQTRRLIIEHGLRRRCRGLLGGESAFRGGDVVVH